MEIKKISPDNIIPDPDQPREHFDKERIKELAESMKEFGQLEAIKVKPLKGTDNYQIVFGERRWRAGKFAKMDLDCIVEDVDKKRQEIEGLIENVHREDLEVTEKGKKAYQIFQLYGIDLPTKKLAIIIHSIEGKLAQRNSSRASSTLDVQQQNIYEVCKKINKQLRTIQLWLEAISISPEIQKIEVQKSKERKIAGHTLARLSTIPDEDLQEKVYTKIDEQEMGQNEASRFITKIKQADTEIQEAILTPGIKPIIEEEPEKPMHIEIPEEDAKSLKQAIEEDRREQEEKLKQPEVKEQARLMNSWIAHSHMDLDHLTCPVCGADHTKLVWSCHKISVDEAHQMLHDKLDKKKK